MADILAPRIVNTLILSGVAFLLYIPLALIPAAIQALNRDRTVDHVLSVLTLVFVSMPEFLLGTLMLIVFVIAITRACPRPPWWWSLPLSADWVEALVLPSVTLAIVMAVYAVRMLRDNLIEVLESQYIRMAELKGLPRHLVLLRHGVMNALGPTLNITALNISYLIGGVVVLEKVFGFPGFGSLLIDACCCATFRSSKRRC